MPALKTIYYVDDSTDIRELAKIALESFGGFEVETFSNGEEFLGRIQHAVPELVLLDVTMPVMDGPTTLKTLRGNPSYSALPVVFMTARVHGAESKPLLDLGAVGVIAKPFDPMTLCDQINQIWQRL